MIKSVALSPAFFIREWQVYPDLGYIQRGDTNIHLEPKVMDVFVCLATNAGQVVSKDTLVEQVWDGRAVSDIVITRCISVLRSSLDDNPREPRYIETLPKRGYRILPGVIGTPAPPTAKTPKRRAHKWWPIATVLVLAIMSGAFLLSRNERTHYSPTTVKSIAVLPFVNMSGPEQQYFCDGISEQLILTLSEIPGLEVAARTSSFRFRNTDRDVREIARELGVLSVIEGSVRRAGNTVRVTAQLVDSESGYQLWSGSFDGPIEDTFELQERISLEISASISSRDKAARSAADSLTRPQNFAAYDKYLLARYMLNQRRADELEESVKLFEESIELDPNFGPSYLGLAYAYALIPSYLPVDAIETYAKSLQVLDAGIEADPYIAEAGAGVRGFLHLKRGNWTAAEAQFLRALRSRHVEPTSYLWYSQLLATVGRLDESLEHARRGRDMDPLSPVANSRLAIAYLWVGQNEQARRYFEIADTLSIDSAVHTESYSLLLLREGNISEMQTRVQSLQAESPRHVDWMPALIHALRDPASRGSAVSEVTTALSQNRVSSRVGLVALGLLGAGDEAAALLQAQIDSRQIFEYELLFIEELSVLRKHPSFTSTLIQLGLPDYWRARGCSWRDDALQCDR